ncbi:MAG TPA: hypothetical protein VGI74_02460 [Streptosporangiaceae bacterium]
MPGRLDLVEEYHGHRVADPYRWLEDAGDPRTQAWCAEQDELFARWAAPSRRVPSSCPIRCAITRSRLRRS